MLLRGHDLFKKWHTMQINSFFFFSLKLLTRDSQEKNWENWFAVWTEKLVGYWYSMQMKKCGYSYNLVLKKTPYHIISEQKSTPIPAAHPYTGVTPTPPPPKLPSRRQWRLNRLGRCLGWSESSLGAQVVLLVYHAAARIYGCAFEGSPTTQHKGAFSHKLVH